MITKDILTDDIDYKNSFKLKLNIRFLHLEYKWYINSNDTYILKVYSYTHNIIVTMIPI